MRRTTFLFATFLCLAACAAPRTVTSARAMANVLREPDVAACAFDLTATVTYVSTNCANENTNVAIADGTGAALCRAENRQWPNRTMPVCGARARLQGYFEKTARGMGFAVLTNYAELSRGPAPQPAEIRLADLSDKRNYFRLCRRTGILRDVLFNEADPYWLLFSVCEPDGAILASMPISSERDYEYLNDRIGCEISVVGIFVPYDHGPHSQVGSKFKIASMDFVQVKERAATADAPSIALDSFRITRASDISPLDRRVTGRIVAAWRKNGALVRTESGDHVFLSLARGAALPQYGANIEATGLPVSDLYRISLLNATWSPLPPPQKLRNSETQKLRNSETHKPSNPETPAFFRHDKTGRPTINYASQGQTVAVTGLVSDLDANEGKCRLLVKDVTDPITLDASANPAILAAVRDGCVVTVRGTCIPEVESPRLNAQFPRLHGACVIPHAPADVEIVDAPSWWATAEWRIVSIVLASGLLLIAAWNIALRRLVEKRGRELAGETLAHAVSDLKVYERTRLAVELHDSIAQALTGIALELDTAELVGDGEPGKMRRHLGIASRALRSCRDELRNCLWDLRHDTLENDDMEAAILKTLQPHCGDAELSVRFSVPRERISDNTAHAILRIVRELTVNAIRHGQATSVKIAGAIEGDRLKFSVRDNGCGFDPDRCPNDEQGHYGLLGIRERVNTFEGQLQIDSKPGQGTKVTISLLIPRETP